MFKKQLTYSAMILVSAAMVMALPGVSTAWAAESDPADLTGQWYGTGRDLITNGEANVNIFLDPANGGAVVHVPELLLFFQPLPAAFGEGWIQIWAGADTYFTGTVAGDSISGAAWSSGFQIAEYQIFREIIELPQPGPGPGPPAGDLPPLYCVGDVYHCAEIVPFDPDIGPGYIDYHLNGETLEDQYRSYVRRDLMQVVKYATAKLEVKTADWDYWNIAPLGLGDMSEADGSIPGTSIGSPGHPAGSHEYGRDIDLAYYQLYATDNNLRAICDAWDGYTYAYHCVDEPYALDLWRTALFISYLAEHPHVRLIAVDGEAGPMLEEKLDELVSLGWIDADHRAAIPLGYEVEDTGQYLYLHHHHHMHVGMKDMYDVLSEVDLKPERLNRRSKGKFITGYIEFAEETLDVIDVSQIDLSSVGLLVDGHTLVPAEMGHAIVSDYNSNGIPDLEVKFDKQLVTEAIGEGSVEVAITGAVDFDFYLGLTFQGTDTIVVK